jgi:hypothetical protein
LAEDIQINRLDKFYGGININKKTSGAGAALNVEEIDIFENPDYIRPETIFDPSLVATDFALSRPGSVESLTRAGTTATLTWLRDHDLIVGSVIKLTGATPAEWDGTYTVTDIPNDDTVEFTVAGTEAAISVKPTVTIPRVEILDMTASGGLTFGEQIFGISQNKSGIANTPKMMILSSGAAGWSHYFTPFSNCDIKQIPSLMYHVQSESGTLKEYLYYNGLRGSNSTSLFRVDFVTSGTAVTQSSTDVDATPMTLTGINTSNNDVNSPFPHIRSQGELFVGHGQFIAKIDSSGIFTEKAFTLPIGYTAVDMAELGDQIYILVKDKTTNPDSKIIIWDTDSETAFDDIITIPFDGPQIIVNQRELIRVICVSEGELRAYQISGKIPIETHRLENVQEFDEFGSDYGDGGIYYPVPIQTKIVREGLFQFGVWKTDKSGMYAIGQTRENFPLALVLRRRFDTSDYSEHRPVCSASNEKRTASSFFDNNVALDDFNLAYVGTTRSSNATYESKLLDIDTPETVKDWPGFMITTEPFSDEDLKIKVDAKTDDASSYDANSLFTLTTANDQSTVVDGVEDNTYWFRQWTSLVGRNLQVRIRFTSDGTTDLKLRLLSLLSRLHDTL